MSKPATEQWMDGYCRNVFNTREAAVASATDHAQRATCDVTIWRSAAIARYPFPAITIEEIVPAVAQASS